MNAPTTSTVTDRRARAYSDLEPRIRDLTCMAELARFHAIESLGSHSPDETEERKRECNIALFAVIHVEEMVRDLEKAYDAAFKSGEEGAWS
jgi:hypothetical protein